MKNINLTLFLLFSVYFLSAQENTETVVNPVEAQLKAYNARDIDKFVQQYAEDVKVFSYPDKLLYTGRENMRERYKGFFENNPDLHCKLIKRIVQGDTVIDQEDVTVQKDQKHIYAIAIYKVANGQIQEVRFIQ